MKKNGFTLIELLAVIVILAILAIITTVTVSTILDDSRDRLSERQKINIEDAAETYYLKEGMNINDTCISVEELIQKGYIDGVTVKDPENDEEMTGYVKITHSSNQYSYNYQEESCKTCVVEKQYSNKYSVGDIVTCGTEKFYLMYNENNKITMLAMYGLNAGSTTIKEDKIGVQNEKLEEYEKAGMVGFYGGYAGYGYWVLIDEPTLETTLLSKYGNSYPTYVYDNNSELYEYVNQYEKILKNDLNVSTASATLISYEQAEDMKNNYNNPYWLRLPYFYWTGTASHAGGVYIIKTDGSLSSESPGVWCAIRPVITISTSEIQ